MSIRSSTTTPILEGIAALGRDILAKCYAILGQLSQLAKSEEITLLRADLTSAIANNEVDLSPWLSYLDGFPGDGKRVMRHSIRPGWAEAAVEAASPAIVGAFLPFTNANTGTTTSASFVTVTEGAGAGVWRYTSGSALTGGFQRFDVATGQPVGARYNGVPGAYTGSMPFLVPIGKYVYFGGFSSSTTQTSGSTAFYRFNTETGMNEALAAFPKTLMSAEAVHAGGGLILVTAGIVAGVVQASTACSFFVFDANTNSPPVEVVTDVRITKFPSGTGEGMRTLPTGAVLLVDKALNANSTKQSAVLRIGANNTITVGQAEETGANGAGQHSVLGTEVGAHLFNPAGSLVHRTYVEGPGWGPPALALAHPNTAAAGTPNGAFRTTPLPGGGWLVTCQASTNSCYHTLLCPGVQARGDVLVDVYKL